MQELIIVTILPAFVVLTAFLFNMGTKEIVDYKYGLNTGYFKPIAGIISFMYCIFALTGIGFAMGGFKSDPYLYILVIIYVVIFNKYNKYRDEIFIKSSQYKPNKRKYKAFINGGIILVSISSLITFFMLYDKLNLALNMLINKSQNKDYIFLGSLFWTLFMSYGLTIISAGYIYNYGQLFNFKKYKLIFREEFRNTLNELRVEAEKNVISVYILVQTEESMIIKIDGEGIPSITIKREDILNILHIDEKQAMIQEKPLS